MTWDKTAPLDTVAANTIDDEICSMKSDLEDFFTVEHDFPGDPDVPELIHTLPMGDTASRPAAAYEGRLYINTEFLTLQRDTGVAWEDITGASAYGVPAGTKMLFFQASAPTGWTKDTAFGNDELLRVLGTGDISSGGEWGPTSDSQGGHTHTTPSTSLSKGHSGSNDNHDFGSVYWCMTVTAPPSHNLSHDHTSEDGGAHTHTITSSWRPVYANVIVCTKD